MSYDSPFQVDNLLELDQPIEALLARLAPTEQRQSMSYRTGKGLRHFTLGRIAAHDAIRQALGAQGRNLSIEVINGSNSEPVVRLDGADDVVRVSLSHSGSLAVACAWLIQSEERYSIGVDIERVRHTRVAQSTYAFSRRERSILGQAPEGEMVAGLAAWTVKEAVWKALRPAPPSNPVEIEITSLCLDRNIATVKIGTRLTKRLRDRTIRARVCKLDGPDGSYLMAIAEILPSRPVKSSGPNKDRVHPVIRTLL